MTILSPILSNLTSDILISILGDSGQISLPPFILEVDTEEVGASGIDQVTLNVDAAAAFPIDVKYLGNVIHTITSAIDNIITFPDGAGIKQIEIEGLILMVNMAGADKNKMKNIIQFGTLRSDNSGGFFLECQKIKWTATDQLDMVGIDNGLNFFRGTDNLVDSDFSKIDFSNFTTLATLFFQTQKLPRCRSRDSRCVQCALNEQYF